MKNVIVTLGEILLGIALFTLIFVGNGSLRGRSETVFRGVVQQLEALPITTATP